MTVEEARQKSPIAHTPGPWRISSWQPWYIIPGDSAEPVCALAEFTNRGDTEHVFPDDNMAQATANARLIASAPELLEALEDALMMLYADEADVAEIEETIRKAEAAIRKAAGMQFDKTAEEIKGEK